MKLVFIVEYLMSKILVIKYLFSLVVSELTDIVSFDISAGGSKYLLSLGRSEG